jgi:hypothetical protein
MNKLISGLALAAVLVSPVFAFADVSITLYGLNPDTVQQGTIYVDPGYSALSTVDGDLTSSVVTSPVDTDQAGTVSEDYSVTDSTGDTADALRTINVQGSGGTVPYCSGPLAPGWNVSLPGGGCGGTGVFIQPGQSAMVDGKLTECPSWFPAGCLAQ